MKKLLTKLPKIAFVIWLLAITAIATDAFFDNVITHSLKLFNGSLGTNNIVISPPTSVTTSGVIARFPNFTTGSTVGVIQGAIVNNHVAKFTVSGGNIVLADGGSPAGTGTVTSVSVTTQNGVSAVVTNPTTTPALAFTLGAITPTTIVASSTFAFNGSQAFSGVTGNGTKVATGTGTYTSGHGLVIDAGGNLVDSGSVPSTGTPGGSNTQVQFNNSGGFGGISQFTSDGTNVTAGTNALRATVPWITTGLAGPTGLSWLGVSNNASAVNFVTLANAATGTGPTLSATGSDTNIQFNIVSKGSGLVNVVGNVTISPTGIPTLQNALTVTALESSIALVLAGTQPSAVVTGNGSDAATLMSMSGPIGGDTSTTTAARNGGQGGGYELAAGPGGQQTGASSGGSRGGTGGEFFVTTGNGGAATAVTGSVAGGDGGPISLTTGRGGTSATFTGGVGGPFSVTAGAGGISTGTGTNSGRGGIISIVGGTGGDRVAADGTAGNGGDVDIDAGPAGNESGGASAGTAGSLTIGINNAADITIGSNVTIPITLTGAVQVGGTLTPNSTAGIVGTTTNNNVNAGSVGEYVESLVPVGTPVSLTSTTAANVTSISLTAGDWDVSGICNFTNGSATVTATACGITATTATIPTDGSQAYSGAVTTVLTTLNSATPARKRFSLAGTTTIFLVARTTFSAGTSAAFGTINARRAR